MTEIKDNIAAYDQMKHDLELKHMGKWVLFYDSKLIAFFDSMEDAATEAVRQFGRGPYLIRQVGSPPVILPASVMYHPDYGKHQMRIR